MAFALAAALLIGIGIAHSYLGERYILIRLFRQPNLPHLFGNDLFTRRTLRFAWHLTTIAWFGFATLLLVTVPTSTQGELKATLSTVIAATFFTSALFSFAVSRGKHYSWLVFLAVAILVM